MTQVLHVGPGVVFAELPPWRRLELPLEAASECALQACEVVAKLHEAGRAGVFFSPWNLRVIDEGGRFQIRWLVRLAGVSDLEQRIEDVEGDVVALIDLFFSLQPRTTVGRGAEPRRVFADLGMRLSAWYRKKSREIQRDPHRGSRSRARTNREDRAGLDPGRAAALDRLSRVYRREASAERVPGVVSLARLLLSLSGAPATWAVRVDSMPAVISLPRARNDWDQIIADSEARRAMTPELNLSNKFIDLPLAVAYHQRASRSSVQGDLLAALRDVERAIELDPLFSYRTTRATLLDTLGRRAEAYREIDGVLRIFVPIAAAHRRMDAARDAFLAGRLDHRGHREEIDAASAEARRLIREIEDASESSADDLLHDFTEMMPFLRDHELARAHETSGMIAYRDGNLERAERDLLRAMELHPTAFRAHCLGAALYARGDLAGAALAEERSVELEPENTRYRWALVISLRKLGREGEARGHAERILEVEPHVTAHRARFARLF